MRFKFSNSVAAVVLSMAFVITPALLNLTSPFGIDSAHAKKGGGGNGSGNSGGNGNGNSAVTVTEILVERVTEKAAQKVKNRIPLSPWEQEKLQKPKLPRNLVL